MTAQELEAKGKQEVADKDEVRQGRYYQPDVDIFEDETALRIYADMPGVTPERVSIELHNDVLSIQGQVDLSEYDGLQPRYSEYNVGHYSRRFRLSQRERYDGERIAARLENGVLSVELPRAEKAKPRRIQITTE